jgi:hypothetical protein
MTIHPQTSEHDMMIFVGKEEGELGFTHFLHLFSGKFQTCYLNPFQNKVVTTGFVNN